MLLGIAHYVGHSGLFPAAIDLRMACFASGRTDVQPPGGAGPRICGPSLSEHEGRHATTRIDINEQMSRNGHAIPSPVVSLHAESEESLILHFGPHPDHGGNVVLARAYPVPSQRDDTSLRMT